MPPPGDPLEAAAIAAGVNPANAPMIGAMPSALAALMGDPAHAAVLTQRYWGPGGAALTVGFLDSPTRGLRSRILEHLNAWGRHANVSFAESSSDPKVRVARG